MNHFFAIFEISEKIQWYSPRLKRGRIPLNNGIRYRCTFFLYFAGIVEKVKQP